jgi:hypothetical protein
MFVIKWENLRKYDDDYDDTCNPCNRNMSSFFNHRPKNNVKKY